MTCAVGVKVENKRVSVEMIYVHREQVSMIHRMSVFEACALVRVLNAAIHNAELETKLIVDGWKGLEEDDE
jgi:hypothetical protein